MRTPVCSVCAKSNALCQSCESKIKKGELAPVDVELSNFFHERYKDLDAEFVGSFTTKDFIILFMRGKVGAVVGRGGRGVSEISHKLGKRVKIVNLDDDIRRIASEIVFPAAVLGINTLFKENKEVVKVRIAKKNFGRIPIDITSLERVFLKLFSKTVQITFE